MQGTARQHEPQHDHNLAEGAEVGKTGDLCVEGNEYNQPSGQRLSAMQMGHIGHLVHCRHVCNSGRRHTRVLWRDLLSARNIDFPGLVYDLSSAKAATEGIILLLTFTNHSEDDIADRFNCSLGMAEYVSVERPMISWILPQLISYARSHTRQRRRLCLVCMQQLCKCATHRISIVLA